MKHPLIWTVLICGAGVAHAAEVAPAASPAKATSAPAAKVVTKPGAAPAAGGNGGGLSSNSGNTGAQIGPKKPKCPDPNSTVCPAEKAVGK